MINKAIIQIGNDIDHAFSLKDENALVISIEKAETLIYDNKYPDEIAVLDYFIGNAWAGLDSIHSGGTQKQWLYERSEHINAIKAFRKCVLNTSVSEEIKKGIFLQAYTNLGNMFSGSGRIIYAIECWQKALKIESTFGMTGCNFAHGLLLYSNYQYDTNHSALILRHAYRLFKIYSNQSNVHKEAEVTFISDIEWIEKVISKDYLNKSNNFKEFSLGDTENEKSYNKWVLDNKLFLNPLNDLFIDTAIAHDVISLPDMLVQDYTAPVFQGFYNQIKQEFITARYLFYNYKYELFEEDIHYSDKNRQLINTLDYPQYGFRYEQLKNSFKMLYALFDKIGYFINEYFKLGIDRNKVYFKNVWYKDKQINSAIEQLNNNPLRGLYFLSKDLFTKDAEYLEVADPEAQNIYELRNHIEHKYCKIHWFKPDIVEDDLRYDTLAYSITEEDLSEKTNKLLRCVREAIIYLSLSVHVEEKKLNKKGELVMPLSLFNYDE